MTDVTDDNPKPVVIGRTWPDLLADSQTGPKLDIALAGVEDFITDAPGRAWERVKRVLERVDAELEATTIEPKAIPERVAVPVLEAVRLEEREELQDLWAKLLVASAKGQAVDAFFIDIVRKLDAISARLLQALAHAYHEADALFPIPSPPPDAKNPDDRGSRRPSGPPEDLSSLREIPRILEKRAAHSLAAVREAVPNAQDLSLAVTRLLALGLLTPPTMTASREIAPAGWRLLALLGEQKSE